MNQPKQPQGNFKMNLNFRRVGNDKAPPITGKISTPEEPEVEYSFSAFEQIDENGQTYWIGPVDMNRSMRQALNAPSARGTNFVAIRENGFKVFKDYHNGTPNPAYAALSAEQQAKEDAKPAYWASWTRTPELPQLRASAWERDASRYGPWASGNTQHPLTKEQAAELAAAQDRDNLNPAGTMANPPRASIDQFEPTAAPVKRRKEAADRGRA